MTPMTVQEDPEARLAQFLQPLPDPVAVPMRTLAHAWKGGGGALQVGSVAIRLVGTGGFTAGTLSVPRGDRPARLELARPLLEKHGVAADAWMHWSDEFVDLAHHGFDQDAKYPHLPLGDHISIPEMARLVMGLRDLAQMAR